MFGPTDVILIMGRRGCGKSFLSKQIQAIYPRVVRFDTLGEYPDDDGTCYDFAEFGEKIVSLAEADSFTLTYRFSPYRKSNREEFDEALCVLWHRGSVLVVVEEIQTFVSAHAIPWWFEQSLTTGRHRQLAMLCTSQMPRFIHKALISQSNHLFCGTLHEKNDLAYAASVYGDEVELLRRLPERRFLYFRLGAPITEVSNTLGAARAREKTVTLGAARAREKTVTLGAARAREKTVEPEAAKRDDKESPDLSIENSKQEQSQ